MKLSFLYQVYSMGSGYAPSDKHVSVRSWPVTTLLGAVILGAGKSKKYTYKFLSEKKLQLTRAKAYKYSIVTIDDNKFSTTKCSLLKTPRTLTSELSNWELTNSEGGRKVGLISVFMFAIR